MRKAMCGTQKVRSESEILSSVAKLLKARGIMAFRMNVGVAKHGSRYVRYGVKGCADILMFMNHPEPLPVWIECKTEKGKLSDDQKAFCKLVYAKGHNYIVVRSADEMNDWIESEFGRYDQSSSLKLVPKIRINDVKHPPSS